MSRSDDERFRVRPAPPRARPRRRFVSQVIREVSRSGARAGPASDRRGATAFGRGRVAAGLAGRGLDARSRRVVIKSRFVVLRRAGRTSVATHLRYLARDGVTRDGERGRAYGATTDDADLKAFEARGRGDRHQFRFIVSVEDAGQLDGLQAYTRELMQRLSTDLETPLDWIAVDHWDTDNPHTHVVLRGRTGDGRDLVIAPDYMAHGMRRRACELATEWLGPRTELEIRQAQEREVTQSRFTGLDRALLRQAREAVVDLATGRDGDRQRLLRGRLQQLEALGLAERVDAHRWRLSPRLQVALTELGDRGDVLRTMQRALAGEAREWVLPDGAGPLRPVVGRLAAKGLADELGERGYAVIDGVDGRAHYVRLRAGTDLATLPVGGVVEIEGPRERPVDASLQALSGDGVYRAAAHRDRLVAHGDRDPEATLEVHRRRLEALRRAGLVERETDGVWWVPADLAVRAHGLEASARDGVALSLRCALPVERQVTADGATWLDRQLVAGVGLSDGMAASPVPGFGAAVREALGARIDWLVTQGLAQRQGGRVRLARDLLATLTDRELARAGAVLQAETGRVHRSAGVVDGVPVRGVYRQSVALVSGRFAMLDDGTGFHLLPWKPVIESRLGQSMSAVVRGGSVSWSLGRSRDLGRAGGPG